MRVIVVANRLPVSVVVENGNYRLNDSSGGLATSLRRVHEKTEGLWIGWVGEPARVVAPVEERLTEDLHQRRLIPVPLTQAELARYYDGFSNGVVWPLFHYLLDKAHFDAEADYKTYYQVNERFARTVAKHYRAGDCIWVHDYQLMLVPGMLRRLIPDARIGFFLHIPFPASDVFRIFPWRQQVVESLLGADLVGFHTATHRHNFQRAATQLVQVDFEVDRIRVDDREVHLGVFPIGIEVEPFEQSAEEPGVMAEVTRIRNAHPDKQVLLGVDRLDYTKGLPRRLMTFERLLERRPSRRDKLLFIQVAVPSREKIAAYHELRKTVNELAGRINSQFGSPIGSPVQLLYRSIPFSQLVALYRTADVMLVTPLRDGMNLVAKEYVAARIDDTGVLVLSEFAGAAAELREALTVNPYDISGTAATLATALEMDHEEQQLRMRAMRTHVRTFDVHRWANTFIEALMRLGGSEPQRASLGPPVLDDAIVERIVSSLSRVILLDYDGTLVPFYPLPELAVPDASLLKLLARLCNSPRNQVHMITGRPRHGIESWLRNLPLALHAEHGFWSRWPGEDWQANRMADSQWKEGLRPLLKQFVDGTPGSFIEEKDVSLALHYRGADPSLAKERLRWVREELRGRALDELELIEGVKVFEVRLRGVHKGIIVDAIKAQLQPETVVLAIGDDRTDEDIFASLADDAAITVKVGGGASRAKYRLENIAQVRRLLERLCDDQPESGPVALTARTPR
jgi:trehalose 6-phosphate synthase/phosphatase